jgi:hypothetical protein
LLFRADPTSNNAPHALALQLKPEQCGESFHLLIFHTCRQQLLHRKWAELRPKLKIIRF